MNTDIRISVSFKSHRKRKRLRLLLGSGSTDYLLDLWISTAMNHPSGLLSGMDELDIALESGWEDDPTKFVSALMECGFLEKNQDGEYVLHDWEDHQGYVVHAEDRKRKARNAAAKRWGQNTTGMPQACSGDAGSMTEAMPLPAPSPAPVPSPKPEEENKDIISASASPDAGQSPEKSSYLTKRKRKLTGKRLEAFNRFWAAFAYSRGKAEAADAWLDIPQLTDSLVEQIVAAAEREAAARPGIVASGHSPKWAQGWISGRRWEDDATPQAPEKNLDDYLREKGLMQ